MKFEQEFIIRAYETDKSNHIKLSALWNIMQEAASNHAQSLGFDYKTMHPQGVCWVLCRMKLNVERYPGWGETIRVITYPAGVSKIFAIRRYEVFDNKGDIVASAVTCWIIANLETLRPERLNRYVPEMCVPYDGLFPGKLSFNGEIISRRSISAEYGDIDVNNHVNNGCYIAWLENMLSHNNINEHPKFLQVNFIMETKQGDTIEIARYEPNDTERIEMHNREGKIVLQAVCGY